VRCTDGEEKIVMQQFPEHDELLTGLYKLLFEIVASSRRCTEGSTGTADEQEKEGLGMDEVIHILIQSTVIMGRSKTARSASNFLKSLADQPAY
jgi:hypothetical protein